MNDHTQDHDSPRSPSRIFAKTDVFRTRISSLSLAPRNERSDLRRVVVIARVSPARKEAHIASPSHTATHGHHAATAALPGVQISLENGGQEDCGAG